MTQTTITTELDALTVPEVMARLRVGRHKVYDLIRTRQLRSIKVGGARRSRWSRWPHTCLSALRRTTDGQGNANGMGTVTRRKDGRWQAVVYVPQPDGTESASSSMAPRATRPRRNGASWSTKRAPGFRTPTRSPRLASGFRSGWMRSSNRHGRGPRMSSTRCTVASTWPMLGTKRLEA